VLVRWSPMAALLVVTALADLLAAAWVARRRAVGRVSVVVLLLGSGVWCATYALELLTYPRGVRELWGSLEYLGTTLLPPAWFAFALVWTGHREQLTRRLLAALAVEPVVVLGLLALPGTHDLLRSFAPGPLGDVPVVRVGPLYWVHFAWTTALTLAGTTVLVVRLLRLTQAYRRQTAVLAVAAAVPLLGNAASSLGLGPARQYDPTPLAASVGALVLVWGAFRHHLLDLVPLARHLAFDLLDDPVLVVDPLGRIVDRNPAAGRVLGADAEIGATLQALLQGPAALLDATAAGPELRIGADDAAREYELVTTALSDHRGAPSGRLVHLRDVTERKQAERHLRHLAENDALTGLPNRRLLADRLEQAVARAQRSHGRAALLLFDLDRFKDINDTLGHPVGDRVLQEVAARLRAGRRDEDTVARLAGDEFAVLLPEVAGPADAAIVADRALAALARPIRLDGHELHVTASAGVALWPEDGADALELLARVDAAMYRAKAGGRNRARHRRLHPAPATVAALTDRAAPPAPATASGPASDALAGAGLRTAIDDDALRLRFRPVVDLRDGALLALAAHPHWDHPLLGDLPPATVLSLARASGLTDGLQQWLLAQACGQACRWTRGSRRVPVSVRLAPRAAPAGGATGVAADVARVLARTTLPPGLLALEVSEEDVVADPDGVAEDLQELHRLGVRLTLRGFGADRTSLTHLRRLPVDTLVLHREVVDAAPDDPGGARVIGAVVTLAHLLGMSVVAAGVDRPEAAALLRSAGCDAGEGAHLAPPVEADAADALATRSAPRDGDAAAPVAVTSGAPAP